MRYDAGITLIEILIVLMIIVILSAISYPVYESYLIEIRRQDAITSIRENQLLVEDYITANGVTPTSSDVSLLTVSKNGFYNLNYTRVNSESYKITATANPNKSQAFDNNCLDIWITNELDTTLPETCR